MKQLSEGIIDHYESHAREWEADRRRSSWNDKPWHDRFIASLRSGAKVLDLGCGSGSPVASNMAACGLHVTGVDASPTMISICRERLPNQDWVIADMRSLALGGPFDGVLAWDSFFHLSPDDQRLMFDVFAAHSAGSTMLMFNTGPAHGEAVGNYRGDPLYHASLDPGVREVARHGGVRCRRPRCRGPAGRGSDGLARSVASEGGRLHPDRSRLKESRVAIRSS